MIDRPQCVQENESLAPHTTFKIGGTADFFASITTEDELVEVVAWARARKLPFIVIGGGSNVVFADQGYRGLVLALRLLGKTEVVDQDQILVTAAAGEVWDQFVSYTVNQGWWGLENLSAIPGTVGAAPIQNIGAYGVEVAEHIKSVRVYSAAEKSFMDFSAADCQFGYRDSLFKSEIGKGYIITSVTFSLSTRSCPVTHYPDVRAVLEKANECSQHHIRDTIMKIRERKFPDMHIVGTAGSFFKNPIISPEHFVVLKKSYPDLSGHIVDDGVKVSAAWLIDKIAGARGVRAGEVGTHDTHALVFVNYAHATASELDQFASGIAEQIKNKTNITLEREVQFIL